MLLGGISESLFHNEAVSFIPPAVRLHIFSRFMKNKDAVPSKRCVFFMSEIYIYPSCFKMKIQRKTVIVHKAVPNICSCAARLSSPPICCAIV